jgi:excisionase family DNA binding protein
MGRAMTAKVLRGDPATAIDRVIRRDEWPLFLTADETANLLRTTRKGIYVMVERGLLPGVTRLGRRLLFRSDVLLDWLRQKSAPSLKE